MIHPGHAEHFVATVMHPKVFSSSSKASTEPPAEEQAARILIVSGDRAMRNFLRREFLDQNIFADTCATAQDASNVLASQRFDLVVVDLDAKDENAYNCLAEIRSGETSHIPIFTLTTRTGADDTVMALDSGADDCLIKPFSLQEMQARVRCLLRRRVMPSASVTPRAGLVLRPDQNLVIRGSRRIQLTAREFSLLEYLMDHYGNTVSRADLLRDVWQTADDPRTNLVDVYMKYLRDKLDADEENKLIRTVRGVGYVLSAE